MSVCVCVASTCHRLLFSAGFDHEAFVWSPFTSTAVYKLKGHTASMVGVVAVEDRPQVGPRQLGDQHSQTDSRGAG